MRTMLVVPGMPSGTPATMITRWPALAKPSRKAMEPARSTMSSWSCASSATTQCTPHTTDNLRPVARFGVIATTGSFGRSRATRIAVEPELVQQMMADNSSVSAIWRAASAVAARHHQRVGGFDDFGEPVDRLRFFDLGHHGGAAADQPLGLVDVLGALYEGKRDPVDLGGQRRLEIGAVLRRHRRDRQVGIG